MENSDILYMAKQAKELSLRCILKSLFAESNNKIRKFQRLSKQFKIKSKILSNFYNLHSREKSLNVAKATETK